MNISPAEVALICNNPDHIDDYSVKGNKAFYKGELILTDVKVEMLPDPKDKNKIIRSYTFKPVKPVSYVELKHRFS